MDGTGRAMVASPSSGVAGAGWKTRRSMLVRAESACIESIRLSNRDACLGAVLSSPFVWAAAAASAAGSIVSASPSKNRVMAIWLN